MFSQLPDVNQKKKKMWKAVHKKIVCLASENCNLDDRDSGRTE